MVRAKNNTVPFFSGVSELGVVAVGGSGGGSFGSYQKELLASGPLRPLFSRLGKDQSI